ncbi:MAG: hypothetical protein NC121_11715 [Blautia sp.]|nr:hypothetical protein [Blautia sp.]
MVLKLKLKNLAQKCFEGDLTMPKATFWMIGVICLLAGIVYGLCVAPLTHGVTIGSNNGNYDNKYDGCVWGPGEKGEEEEEA